jgi:ribose transport system permease protein/putative xylitol transport system permease protein
VTAEPPVDRSSELELPRRFDWRREPRLWLRSFRHVSRRFEAILMTLVLLVIAFSVTEPTFLTIDNLRSELSTSAILWIVAMGMTLVVLTAGIDLSVGSVLALTGVILAQLINAGVPTVLAIVISLAAGAAIGGGINGLLIGRLGLSFFVVTLGTMEAILGAVNVWTKAGTVYVSSNLINNIGIGHILGIPVPVWFMIVLGIAAFGLLRFTYFGRDVYALGGNLQASRLSGLATKRTLIAVYAISGLCAAIAGVVQVGELGAASPSVGTNLALQAAAAVLLGGTSFTGGVGGVAGTAVGVLFLATLQNGLGIAGVSTYWQDVITGAVLVAAVLMDRARDVDWSVGRIASGFSRGRAALANAVGRGPAAASITGITAVGEAAAPLSVRAPAPAGDQAPTPPSSTRATQGPGAPPTISSRLRKLAQHIDTESLGRFAAVLAITVALVVYLSIAQSRFLTSANINNLLTGVAVLWIVALGMTFVVITVGVDLSVGAVLALSGILLAKLLDLGVPSGLAIVICVAGGVLLGGFINGALIGAVGLSFFVVTLASSVALGGFVNLWAGTSSFPIHSQFIISLGSGYLAGVPVSVWIMVGGFLLGLFVQRSTYFGRAIYASGGNRAAARLAGIRTSWTLVAVYALCAGCAALAGVLEAGRLGDGTPQVGTDIALQAAAAVLLGGTSFTGGVGGVGGTAIGVLFIGTLQDGLDLGGLSIFWQDIVTGAILVSAVLIDRLRRDPSRG